MKKQEATNNFIDKTRSRLIVYLSENDISSNQFADDIGYAPGTISQFINSRYPGRNDKLAVTIDYHLNKIIKGNGVLQIPIIKTKPYKDIFSFLYMTEAEETTCMIVGDNGCGKTVAIKEYAQLHNSIIIESDPVDTTISILKAICIAVGQKPVGRLSTIRDQIIQYAPQKLLIIDETENLDLKILNVIRRIVDKSRLSLALIGGPDLRGMMGSMKKDHIYLWRRIEIHVRIKGITREDAGKIMDASGMEISVLLQDKLFKICKRNDDLHPNASLLVSILKKCCTLSKNNDHVVSDKIINLAKASLLLN